MMILESFQNGRGLLIEGLSQRNGVITKNTVIPVERVKLFESTASPDDRYRFQGIFLVGDKKNANGRIYPFESVLKPECDRYIAEMIGQNFGGGELEHPSNLNLNPERFTHMITKFYYDGVNVIGEAIAGERGMGRVLRDFLDLDFRFGMSSRGVGTVNESYVEDDFELHFVDAVMNPSAPGAFMKRKKADYLRNVSESVLHDEIGLSEKSIEYIKKMISETKVNDSRTDNSVIQQFNTFLNMVKSI